MVDSDCDKLLVVDCSGIGSCLVTLTDDCSKVIVSVSETMLAFRSLMVFISLLISLF